MSIFSSRIDVPIENIDLCNQQYPSIATLLFLYSFNYFFTVIELNVLNKL